MIIGFVFYRGHGWIVLPFFALTLVLALSQSSGEWQGAIFGAGGLVIGLVGWWLNSSSSPSSRLVSEDEEDDPGAPHMFQGFPMQYAALLFFAAGIIMYLVSLNALPPLRVR